MRGRRREERETYLREHQDFGLRALDPQALQVDYDVRYLRPMLFSEEVEDVPFVDFILQGLFGLEM